VTRLQGARLVTVSSRPRRVRRRSPGACIICTAPHQRDPLHRPSSAFVAHLHNPQDAHV